MKYASTKPTNLVIPRAIAPVVPVVTVVTIVRFVRVVAVRLDWEAVIILRLHNLLHHLLPFH